MDINLAFALCATIAFSVFAFRFVNSTEKAIAIILAVFGAVVLYMNLS